MGLFVLDLRDSLKIFSYSFFIILFILTLFSLFAPKDAFAIVYGSGQCFDDGGNPCDYTSLSECQDNIGSPNNDCSQNPWTFRYVWVASNQIAILTMNMTIITVIQRTGVMDQIQGLQDMIRLEGFYPEDVPHLHMMDLIPILPVFPEGSINSAVPILVPGMILLPPVKAVYALLAIKHLREIQIVRLLSAVSPIQGRSAVLTAAAAPVMWKVNVTML